MLGLDLTLQSAARQGPVGTALPLPFLLTPPAISGTPVPGAMLSGDTGEWSAADSLAWTWLRDGAPIAGASGSGAAVSGYTVDTADRGSALRLSVTASNAAGSRTAFSDALTVPDGAFAAGFGAGFGA